MLKLRELFGTAIVIVTHDIGVVRAMADTVLVLKNGKTIEYGTADRVLDQFPSQYSRWFRVTF
jgi:ABC-type glutathione transport system ATPase component